MKRILLAGLFILGWGVAQAQVAVVAPSLELQEAMNHAEQLQQMVQTYQTMVNVKDGINKGIDAVEKVNNKLATIRDVQEIATRSAACVGRIKQVYEMIGNLRLDVQYTTSLVDLCNQPSRRYIRASPGDARMYRRDGLRGPGLFGQVSGDERCGAPCRDP